MKRMLFLLLAVLMLIVAPTMLLRAEAAEIVDSGTCGENLTWTLDDTGTLTVSGSGAMDDCWNAPWDPLQESIVSVVVEDGVTTIGRYAFRGCTSLSSITIPDSVLWIGEYTFSGCTSLSDITIPDSVTTIGYGAFYGCTSLTDITIPDGVTEIGPWMFMDCTNLSSITLPDSVTSIGVSAFSYCTSLTGITLPDSVTSIGACAFEGCTSLTGITIPDSVTSIGYLAFSDCTSLSTVHYAGTEAQKANIEIEEDNGYLEEATWHYECTGTNCPGTPSEETPPTEPVPTEPVPTEPVPTEPVPTEPVPTEPVPTEPEATEPLHTEPVATEPEATEPEVTEPEATEPEATKPVEPPMENPFVDVAADAYYAAPVLWAVEEGITNGLSADSFGPDATCTRGQIVTFLWRANGSPEPKMEFNPFSDVSSSDYFYNAVLWAVENGITSGMGDGTFAPDAGCTRGQVATFLWRAEGKPASDAENIFTDITPDAYYYDAVLWAVANEITNGMGNGAFAPDATCTRGQIVTFLYRAMA